MTGASGYLGGVLCERAADAVGTYLRHRPSGCEAVQLDVRDRDAVRRVVDSVRPDAVIHTAYVQDGPGARATIVDGSAAVAEAMRGIRLVHLSTDVVFSGTLGRAYTEDDEPDPITEYGRFKLEAERVVAERAPDAVLVRTSLIYGGAVPSRHEQVALDAARGESGFRFFADELRCPAQVDDLAAALLELVELPVSGPLHVVPDEALSRLDFARLVARANGLGTDRIKAHDQSAREAGRPADCRLDSSRAAALLSTRLRGPNEVLAR